MNNSKDSGRPARERFNHIVMSKADLDIALITGEKIWTLCDKFIKPTLRVGSGGLADRPGWSKCPRCRRVADLLRERAALRNEINRMRREMYSIEKEYRGIWAGEPLHVEEVVA